TRNNFRTIISKIVSSYSIIQAYDKDRRIEINADNLINYVKVLPSYKSYHKVKPLFDLTNLLSSSKYAVIHLINGDKAYVVLNNYQHKELNDAVIFVSADGKETWWISKN
ncbi:MAG: hypothetical protein GXN99_00925, partial [Candidatus Nanohaloarchaeota archaeon]|nr:hypothetical protein [Candidatus Nanohaloarchaeota archaeon]